MKVPWKPYGVWWARLTRAMGPFSICCASRTTNWVRCFLQLYSCAITQPSSSSLHPSPTMLLVPTHQFSFLLDKKMKQTKDSLVKPIKARTRNKDRLTKDCKLLPGAPHLPVVTCLYVERGNQSCNRAREQKSRGD